jgi:hypothetical protein
VSLPLQDLLFEAEESAIRVQVKEEIEEPKEAAVNKRDRVS